MSKKVLSIILVVIIIASALSVGGVSFAAETEEYKLDYPTQSEIRQKYKELMFDTSAEAEYAEDYSTAEPYKAGVLSDKTLQDGLNALNFCRYVAGLPADVELKEDYSEKCAAASLVNAVNGALSHSPAQPEGMDNTLYNLGKEGAGSSNIAMGYTNISDSIVRGYMDDSNSGNIDRVGHRRWILNPSMKYTGFGMAGRYSALYAFDRSRTESFAGEYVCWPAKNMPYELYEQASETNGYAFSVSLGDKYDAPVLDELTVDVTSAKLDKSWHLNSDSDDKSSLYLTVNNDGYGMPKCIIFNVGLFPENDIVTVKINGTTRSGADSPIQYTVNFFNAEDETSLFDYSALEDGTIRITKYNGDLTEVTVPSEIDGKKVSSLLGAFMGNKTVEKVILPEGITSIDAFCFFGCSALTDINIPSTVRIIGESAFESCSSLASVNIPDSVTSINGSSFKGTALYNNAPDNELFCIGDWGLCYKGTLPDKLVIKDGVKYIAAQAFDNEKLTEVIIPDSVEVLGDGAFYRCSDLKSVTFGTGITTIKGNAFYGCASLETVKLSEGLKVIDEFAFYECGNLKSITVPESVVEIGDYALGYVYDYDIIQNIGVEGFTIYGKSGSAAEKYAVANGFEFVAEGEAAELDLVASEAGAAGENLYSGDSTGLYVVIRNNGDTAFSGEIAVNFAVAGTTVDAVTVNVSIEPGRSAVVTSTREWEADIGTWAVRADVNYKQTVAETNYKNNGIKGRIAVAD